MKVERPVNSTCRTILRTGRCQRWKSAQYQPWCSRTHMLRDLRRRLPPEAFAQIVKTMEQESRGREAEDARG